MSLGTFWLEEKPDGEVQLGVEDYDVAFFGGADHEMIYTLDPENAKKFFEVLSGICTGTHEEMIEEVFGIHLSKVRVGEWLKEYGIEFECFTWTS